MQKTQRQLQVGETIKRALCEIFIRDDLMNIMSSYITILRVDISPDIKKAIVYLNIFGDEKNNPKIIKKLNGLISNIRYELAKKVVFRVVPEIVFIHDDNEKKALLLEELINKESLKYKNKNNVDFDKKKK